MGKVCPKIHRLLNECTPFVLPVIACAFFMVCLGSGVYLIGNCWQYDQFSETAEQAAAKSCMRILGGCTLFSLAGGVFLYLWRSEFYRIIRKKGHP